MFARRNFALSHEQDQTRRNDFATLINNNNTQANFQISSETVGNKLSGTMDVGINLVSRSTYSYINTKENYPDLSFEVNIRVAVKSSTRRWIIGSTPNANESCLYLLLRNYSVWEIPCELVQELHWKSA